MHPELQPDILISAYAQSLFPMADDDGEILWFSPDPRAILPLDTFHVSGNLRRRCNSDKFTVTVDRDFRTVMERCSARDEGTWISVDILDAYERLHEMGYAHSVETRVDDRLVGGLYGVCIGGAFFGESMFHSETDASKVALVHLVDRMKSRGFTLLDTQFTTPHLEQFGVLEIPRADYLAQLNHALSQTCQFADKS